MTNPRNQLAVKTGQDGDPEEVIITPDKVPAVIIEGIFTMSKRMIVAVILGSAVALTTPVVTVAEVVDQKVNPDATTEESGAFAWLDKAKGVYEGTKKNVTGLFASDDEKLLAAQAKIDELLKRNAQLERQVIDATIDAGVEHNRAVMCAASVLTYLEEIGITDEESANGK